LLHPPIDAIPEPSDARSRAFDGRSGTLFGPGGEASTVVQQRRATEDLAGLDTADEDPMVAGLDRPRHHAGRVRDRCVAQDGGSVETPTNAWFSRPFGCPASSSVVTMTTPVGNDAETAR